jgi:hypothetical protein
MKMHLVASVVAVLMVCAGGAFAQTGKPGDWTGGPPFALDLFEPTGEAQPGVPYEVVEYDVPALLGPGALLGAGDVVLNEVVNGQQTNVISDIVRFGNFNAVNQHQIIQFFSDNGVTPLNPADLGGLSPNAVFVGEFTDPVIYDAFGAHYFFHSDVEVPEPGTMVLVGLGAIGLLAISRRRK